MQRDNLALWECDASKEVVYSVYSANGDDFKQIDI